MVPLKGWAGRGLLIDVGERKFKFFNIEAEVLRDYIGGRGLAARLLWDLNEPGVDPLSPKNHLIVAVGPLTGYPLPSSGKLVVASKSPLTHGYGDGNIGCKAAVHIRKLGIDAIVIKGASRDPLLLHISKEGVEFVKADDLWGLSTWEAEERIRKQYGKEVGTLLIGPGGESLVRFATVVSELGRSAGRPGMGAVLGSKKVKALVIDGDGGELPEPASPNELRELGQEAYKAVKEAPNYDFWMRQGTMMTVAWAQKASVLPTKNFSEGVFDEADKISGDVMERMRVLRKGCPMCNMPCGHVVGYKADSIEGRAELDYENVAMLGSNLLIGDLSKVSHLNRLADEYGIDTISLGSVIAFAMEATEQRIIERSEGIEWGDFRAACDLIEDIVRWRGLGAKLALGVRRASMELGGGSERFAIHVKGLEVSAYDCHAAPAMALAYGTSSIGAHHKDAWIISYEVQTNRLAYSEEKVKKLVWMQNIRGAMFESLVTCRLPWIELGLNLDYYPKLLRASTGVTYTWDDLEVFANRVYSLIRAFWVREYLYEGRGWGRHMDYPPLKWFEKPLTKGPLAGTKLDRDGYDSMLSKYYELRGWDRSGVPRVDTLRRLGLGFTIKHVGHH